jgi:hypothetical protein
VVWSKTQPIGNNVRRVGRDASLAAAALAFVAGSLARAQDPVQHWEFGTDGVIEDAALG